jgi:WD40-like Beta Propeller Repeat/HYR domain
MTVRRIRMLLAVGALAALTVSVGPAQSAFPGTNGRIAFASDRDGALDVYVMAADGSAQARLTTAAGTDEYPMWSPDGTRIVFSSARESNNRIFRMNADGSSQTRLTEPPLTVFGDEEPSWSRDGSRIAFRSDRELGDLHIWTMNAAGTGLLRLTGAGTGTNINPVWAPGVDRIAFASSRDGDFEIYTMDASGGNVLQHTSNGAFDSNPDWGPNGRIAFQSDIDGDVDVWVLNQDGTLTQLTNDPAFDSAPTWSPDGTKLAFQSNRDGDFEIFTMNADGSGVLQLTHNTATDRVADWQPLTSGGDVTPPQLLLPPPIGVNAAIPAGAVVTYTVSAVDVVDPNPTLSCSHASGATFAIGVTTVSCTATDRAGNTSTGSFTVTVVGARAQIERLLQDVIGASGLTPTQKTFLRTRLQNLLTNFNPDNPVHRNVTCITLQVFSLVVSAWRGLPIPPALADAWLADSRRIRSVLRC